MTKNIFNMLGEAVYTENIDSGRRWLLSDITGKPIYRWNNRHHQFRHTYDTLQRPVDMYVKEGTSEKLVEKAVYGTVSDVSTNRNGKLFKQYDQSGFNTFIEYDFKGNLVYLRKRFCDAYNQTIDWSGSPALLSDIFNTEFTYDAMNRPKSMKQPDNSVIAYDYNKAGLLDKMKAKIRGSATWTDFVNNINYNEKGQRTKIFYENGSKTSYYYDAETFRLTRLLTTRDTGSDILQDINYTYDAVGNITEIEDDAQQTHYYSNSVVEPKGKYYYDALYRLTKATGRELSSLAMPSHTDFVNNLAVPNTASNAMQNYTQEYTYDELGNINQMKSVGDWTRDYYYETANNRLKNHDNQTDVYDYDEHGNCTEMPHLPDLVWDYKDELKEVTLDASNNKAYYVYDAGGERVRKVVDKGSVVEERLYVGGFEVYRKTVSGTLDYERETLKITEGRNTIAQLETKTVENGNNISSPTTNQRYQYSNHLGSACLELDENAAIISYEEYHPFGTTSYRSGSSATEVSLKRYKYVGKERDEETGLYYYGARYYSAWLCRFVSVDPLQFEYPHYTPYQYAGNKPVTFIDLDGLEEFKHDAEIKGKAKSPVICGGSNISFVNKKQDELNKNIKQLVNISREISDIEKQIDDQQNLILGSELNNNNANLKSILTDPLKAEYSKISRKTQTLEKQAEIIDNAIKAIIIESPNVQHFASANQRKYFPEGALEQKFNVINEINEDLIAKNSEAMINVDIGTVPGSTRAVAGTGMSKTTDGYFGNIILESNNREQKDINSSMANELGDVYFSIVLEGSTWEREDTQMRNDFEAKYSYLETNKQEYEQRFNTVLYGNLHSTNVSFYIQEAFNK
ncbi:MAG: hypothetical protein HN704_12715 [Bacteroidetes bacterium]|jgi:RHS repeat-associated protein|nr:hypothetical protein [Bacteroidota bacterium]MBT6835528.1 hypothetical protein [Bacteroidota bacterium]MBT7144871.1 hypothetical protein [Bacteroidota bacterium]MBT7492456.1 hypothetical protein [Bacteroidota bacterium]